MKLIKLQDKFILVIDEDAKNNELLYNIENNTICRAMGDAEVSHFKIVAGVEFLPSIDFSLLSEEDCKTIGWVDVEKLAEKIVINNNPNGAENFSMSVFNGLVKDIINGFKIAQSLNDKMFSLEDMTSFAKFSVDNNVCEEENRYYQYWELFKMWQSLQQTSWDCNYELSEDKKSYIIIKIKL